MNKHVCAVVVTYNRIELLQKCLNAILTQTCSVDQILVIDNASTDGTPELLSEKGYLDNSLINYMRMSTNEGGAGGFYKGCKRAFELGYEWLWLMNDDGLPHPETLEHLLAPPDLLFRGPLVLAQEDNTGQKLAFEYPIDISGNVYIKTRKEAEEVADRGLMWKSVSPFNGVLISRKVIEQIGLPKKEFFIWGDEWDYVFRAKKAGISIATVTKAIFWHPANKLKVREFKLLNRTYLLPYADTPLRNYLLIRNHAYIKSRHNSLFAWLKHTLKFLLYYSTHSGQLSPLDVLTYSLEGLRGDFHGHQKFLEAERGSND